MNLLSINISANMDAISNLTNFGTRLTYASIGYISYRIGLVRMKGLTNYENKQIERGGYKRKTMKIMKMKKTKKSKKSRKTKKTKKSRRTRK